MSPAPLSFEPAECETDQFDTTLQRCRNALRFQFRIFLELLVKVGDIIARDDNILTLETGKVALDIPSPYAGKVVAIHVTEGDTVDEGALLVTLESI